MAENLSDDLELIGPSKEIQDYAAEQRREALRKMEEFRRLCKKGVRVQFDQPEESADA